VVLYEVTGHQSAHASEQVCQHMQEEPINIGVISFSLLEESQTNQVYRQPTRSNRRHL